MEVRDKLLPWSILIGLNEVTLVLQLYFWEMHMCVLLVYMYGMLVVKLSMSGFSGRFFSNCMLFAGNSVYTQTSKGGKTDYELTAQVN
jgi:hypothetical protein